MTTTKRPPRLDKTVRVALEKARGTWVSVASKSGVSYSWISKFMNGRIQNPGHETLMAIKKALGK